MERLLAHRLRSLAAALRTVVRPLPRCFRPIGRHRAAHGRRWRCVSHSGRVETPRTYDAGRIISRILKTRLPSTTFVRAWNKERQARRGDEVATTATSSLDG